MKTASRARKSNAGKLKEASRIAMQHPVLLCMDVDELMTLSMAPWMTVGRDAEFRRQYQDLGTFRALPFEPRYSVFERMWDEAIAAGALLGAKPDERWVCGAEPHEHD